MSTEYYADYIKKTTFDPESHSTRSKIEEAATDVKKKPASKTPKVEVEPTEVPEENLDEKGKGLWANIHAKRARGEKPNPPGHPDRPSAADLKRSQNKEDVASEELHGDQHKLDHNKDNKIDKADMKMVRKKGAVKNHPMAEKKSLASLRNASVFDGKERLKKMQSQKPKPAIKPLTTTYQAEATFKVNVEGLPTMYIDGAGAGEIKSSLRKQLKDPKTITSIEKISTSEKKKELRAKVSEEEQVDEISNRAKGAYVRVASRDAAYQSSKATSAIHNNDSADSKRQDIRNADRKRDNRLQGIDRATKGMKNEDAVVDELSRDTLGSYIQKASDASKHKGMSTKKVDNRYSGVSKASMKIDKMEEDIGDAAAKNKSLSGVSTSVNKSANRVTTSSDYGTVVKDRSGGLRSVTSPKVGGAQVKQTYRPDSTPGYGKASYTNGPTTLSVKGSPETGYTKSASYSMAGGKASATNRYDGSKSRTSSIKMPEMAEDYSDQKAHLKKVGKGGQVSYTNSGKKMSGEYGGLKNKGGRSYAMVHHKTHSAMVPLPQINHKESVEATDEGIMDAISKVKQGASNMVSSYRKKRNVAEPGKGTNYLKK